MKVLVAINETTYAEAIADFINGHVWDEHTTFSILTVLEPMKVGSVKAVLPGPLLDEMVHEKAELAERLQENFVRSISTSVGRNKIKKKILEGFPASTITNEIIDEKIDMLIVGSHGRHGIKRLLLGSVSLHLVTTAPCSVIVIRLPESEKDKTRVA